MTLRHHSSSVLLWVAIIATAAMSWFVTQAAGLPWYRGYQMSIFQQPSPAWALLVITLMAIAGLKIGTLIASQREEAGFVVALAGLAGLSFRSGTVRSVYHANAAPGVFLQLFAEMAFYLVLAAALWFAMRWWRGSRFAPAAFARTQPLVTAAPWLALTSVVCQTVLCFLLLYALAQSDAKGQALGAVAAAAAVSVIGVRLVMPIPSPAPYWIAPLLAATIGYLVNYFAPGGAATGHPAGPFAPLARVLPLDHLVAGPAAALFAYWYTQSMGEETQPAEATPA
jgi:hypothetical protein